MRSSAVRVRCLSRSKSKQKSQTGFLISTGHPPGPPEVPGETRYRRFFVKAKQNEKNTSRWRQLRRSLRAASERVMNLLFFLCGILAIAVWR